MGQAKRRGSFEDRLLQHQARKALIAQQQAEAPRLLIWWQLDMSIERMERRQSSRLRSASLLNAILGGLSVPYRIG